jgi:hypothetical protein
LTSLINWPEVGPKHELNFRYLFIMHS